MPPYPDKNVTILMVDDDPFDCRMVQRALSASQVSHELRFVHTGEEMLDSLYQRGPYADLSLAPCPRLILLDLNMPQMDGYEALREMKSDPALRQIPVVVLTTSQADHDIDRCYALGANSFVAKPAGFRTLVKVMKCLADYWLGTSELPACPEF